MIIIVTQPQTFHPAGSNASLAIDRLLRSINAIDSRSLDESNAPMEGLFCQLLVRSLQRLVLEGKIREPMYHICALLIPPVARMSSNVDSASKAIVPQ